MESTTISRPATVAAPTVIVRPTATGPLTVVARRRRHTVSAWLLKAVLDPRLAAGARPESGRLLAVRAGQLVDPSHRRALADAWDRITDRATSPTGVFDPRVPVARRAVLAATTEIEALTAALRSGSPLAARDVARAAALLADATSPVYTGTPDLRSVVTELVTDLGTGRDDG